MKTRKRIGIILLFLLLGLLGVGGVYQVSRWADGDPGPSAATESERFELPTPELIVGPEPQPGGALATLVRFDRSVKAKRAERKRDGAKRLREA